MEQGPGRRPSGRESHRAPESLYDGNVLHQNRQKQGLINGRSDLYKDPAAWCRVQYDGRLTAATGFHCCKIRMLDSSILQKNHILRKSLESHSE